MNWRTIVTILLTLCVIAIAAAIAVLSLAMSGLSPQLSERVDSYVSLGPPDAPVPPPGTLGPGGRLVIPAIEVDATVIVVGEDAGGALETPDNGWDVGWYDFSAVPGQAGNSVMTGHVDYYNIGPAVFWRLRDLKPGDEVQVHLPEGGGIVSYRVAQVDAYNADSAPVDTILGPADAEILTLITCTGQFNRALREYDQRLVVRAELVP